MTWPIFYQVGLNGTSLLNDSGEIELASSQVLAAHPSIKKYLPKCKINDCRRFNLLIPERAANGVWESYEVGGVRGGKEAEIIIALSIKLVCWSSRSLTKSRRN